MSRDWQKDMELCEKATSGPWEVVGRSQLIGHSGRVAVREKDAFDWVCSAQVSNCPNWENDITFTAEARQVLPYWLQQAAAEKERADQAEAREQKLREVIEGALRDATKWENPYEGYNDLQKALDSLYPKEEEAK